jgi:hypothetical protein
VKRFRVKIILLFERKMKTPVLRRERTHTMFYLHAINVTYNICFLCTIKRKEEEYGTKIV